jgi:hypothetical protein
MDTQTEYPVAVFLQRVLDLFQALRFEEIGPAHRNQIGIIHLPEEQAPALFPQKFE